MKSISIFPNLEKIPTKLNLLINFSLHTRPPTLNSGIVINFIDDDYTAITS